MDVRVEALRFVVIDSEVGEAVEERVERRMRLQTCEVQLDDRRLAPQPK